MSRWRLRILYFVLLPAVTAAAGILGYYSWQTATQFAELGEETIVQATLLLVREKVDRIEQMIISADNAVFDMIDLDSPDTIQTTWALRADELSPSVTAVFILDDSGSIVSYATRGTERERQELRKIFLERILPDLELERQKPGRLKHLHRSYGGKNHLLSYKALRHHGRRQYVVACHDTEYIVREVVPGLFATDEGKRLYNVVDERNRRVFGPSLARAGDYLVGHRFPTTLYAWRLQVAPKQAPLLDAKSRSRRVNEVALIGTSFAVILMGVIFLLYAADKERRLNALKSEFIANVSHELKTPLSVIRMFAELLLTKRVQNPKKQEQYLEIVCRESERLGALIENVLDFAALERGKPQYDLRTGDLSGVVARATEAVRYRMEREATEVALEVEPELPPVRFDEQALLLAIINLLDNALKHGAGSPIALRVESSGDEVVLHVRDHGPGIAPDHLKRIFERFFKSRSTAGTRGSGIGLSIVRHIADVHGGRAWAENAEGGGAVVSIALPAARREDATVPATAAMSPSFGPQSSAPGD